MPPMIVDLVVSKISKIPKISTIDTGWAGRARDQNWSHEAHQPRRRAPRARSGHQHADELQRRRAPVHLVAGRAG